MRATRVLMAGGLSVAAGLMLAGGSVALAAADPATAAAAPAPAQPTQGWSGHPGGWGDHGGPLADVLALDLSDAQRASIQAILAAAKPSIEQLRQQMHANAQPLHDAKPEDPGYAQLVAYVRQLNGPLHDELKAQHAKVYAECFALLDPDQQAQAKKIGTARHSQLLPTG